MHPATDCNKETRTRLRISAFGAATGIGVPCVDAGLDLGAGLGAHEGHLRRFTFGVTAGIADHELAESADRLIFRITLQDSLEMFEHDQPLLGQIGRRRNGPVLPHASQVAIYPWIADRPAGNDKTVQTGFFHQLDRGGGIENVTTTHDGRVGEAALYCGREVPVGFAAVPLRDGTPMNHKGIDTLLDRAGHDLPEIIQRPGLVIEPDAELHQDGAGDGVANRLEDVDDRVRVVEQRPAASSMQDFGDGAGKIQVHEVVSGGHESARGRGHGRRRLADDLRAYGVFIGAGAKAGLAQDAGIGRTLVQNHIGHRKGTAEPAGERAHGVVAVAAQRGLEEGHVQRQTAEFQTDGATHILFVARLFSSYVTPALSKRSDTLDRPAYCYIRLARRQPPYARRKNRHRYRPELAEALSLPKGQSKENTESREK